MLSDPSLSREKTQGQIGFRENILTIPNFDETHEEFMVRCVELGNDEETCMSFHKGHTFVDPNKELSERFKKLANIR